MSNRYEHVLNQLANLPNKKVVGDSTFILCPFHSERTPSGRIYHSPLSKSPGNFKCYGCGKSAHWNEVATALNLQKFGWSKPIERTPHDLTPRTEEDVQHTQVLEPLPTGKMWRGFKTSFLTRIGCSLTYRYSTPYLYMPVIVGEHTRGYVLGRLQKVKGLISYINAPGGWSKDYGLFPFHYVAGLQPETVVLVEGPRDAMRLLAEGIPALAILGTQSWSDRKTRTLELLGCRRVILCLDGDPAGIEGAAKIAEYCKSMFDTSIFSLAGKGSPYWPYRKEDDPKKAADRDGVQLWDAFTMPDEKIEELRQLL